MSEFLCLRFRDTEINPYSVLAWSIVTSHGSIEQSGYALLSELAEALPTTDVSRRCIVIVSSESVLLTTVTLPLKQQRHMRQVLPFLVEEQIIDPIENMHLAVPLLHSTESVQVVAIQKTKLSEWLDCLDEASIQPDYLFMDVLCVPEIHRDTQTPWQLLFDDQKLLFHNHQYSGMTLDANLAKTVLGINIHKQNMSEEGNEGELSLDDGSLEASLISVAKDTEAFELMGVKAIRAAELAERAEASKEGETPEREDYENFEEHDESDFDEALDDDGIEEADHSTEESYWLQEIDDFLRSENIKTYRVNYSETASELLALGAVKKLETNLNLLQGDFLPANANQANRLFLRKMVVGIAASVALFLLVTLGGGAYLNSQADSYFDKSVAVYKSLFPKQRRIKDPVKQMKRQLSGAMVGGTTSEFLPLLDAASSSLKTLEEQEATDASIEQLRYDVERGHIAIDIQANDIDELEKYRDLLTAQGLKVDILSANQDGGVVKGRLQIGRS